MELQNGYKVIYEKAADGKRTFYASKSSVNPTVEADEIVSFVDADYCGKMIYEYKGKFYVTEGKTPVYDENGVPQDKQLTEFDKVFVKTETPVQEPEVPVAPEEPSTFSLRRGAAEPEVAVEPVVEEVATTKKSSRKKTETVTEEVTE